MITKFAKISMSYSVFQTPLLKSALVTITTQVYFSSHKTRRLFWNDAITLRSADDQIPEPCQGSIDASRKLRKWTCTRFRFAIATRTFAGQRERSEMLGATKTKLLEVLSRKSFEERPCFSQKHTHAKFLRIFIST